MKRVLTVFAALLAGCTEPVRIEDRWFEGVVVERWDVVDTFANTTTTSLRIDSTPGDGTSTCGDQAMVTLTDETVVFWSDAPGVAISRSYLVPPRSVRILPPDDPRDICPMQITATSIAVIR